MGYTRPYIMDLPGMEQKLQGTHPEFTPEALSTTKLQEIIREFVRLEAHCDDARALCSDNVIRIIKGETPLPYNPVTGPCPDNNI